MAAILVLLAGVADAAAPWSRAELRQALQEGGLVIVVRHASSPREAPDAAAANPDNPARERQLDEAGRRDAAAMGQSMRVAEIPLGAVLTSPTYRARETARLAGWPSPQVREALGDGGRGMQGTGESAGDWLRREAANFPVGTNTILVTHLPNLEAAFPQEAAAGIEEGESLVFGPDGAGGFTLRGRLRITEWAILEEGARKRKGPGTT